MEGGEGNITRGYIYIYLYICVCVCECVMYLSIYPSYLISSHLIYQSIYIYI
jgi:hypothetical protein